MKLAIRRHGIVIRTVAVTGEKASIGNSETADVKIEDPYLGAHIADLVNRNGTWHLVDAGTSLEGISRDGTRIEEEELVSGAVYNVGAFEFVPEIEGEPGRPAPGSTAAPPQAAAGAVPQTVMEADLDAIRSAAGIGRSTPPPVPETVVEPDLGAIRRQAGLDPGGAVPKTMMDVDIRDLRQSAPPVQPRPVVHPPHVAAPPPVPPAAPHSPPRKRLLLVIGIFGVGVLILLVIAVLTSGGEKKAAAPQVVAKPAPPVVAPAAPAAPAAASREALADTMKIDEALASWEKSLDAADVRQKALYAETALDLALVHSANNDSAAARKYFEKVVRFGSADSRAVAIARQRLQATN